MFFHNPNTAKDFFQTAYVLGLDSLDDERAIVAADFDRDGDLDVVTSSLQRLKLFENRLPRQNFIRLKLKATKTHYYGLGAEVRVRVGDTVQRDYVKLTAGFQSQVPRDLHFGLGKSQSVDEITVRWPSGDESVFTDIDAGSLYVLTEGQKELAEKTIAKWSQSNANQMAKRKSLNILAETLTGQRKALATSGVPAVINFWAPWCKPCKTELPDLEKVSKRYRGKVQFIGVSVEREKRKLVEEAIKNFGLTYEQFVADDALVESYFGSDGEIPLPSTFVFSGTGTLVRVFSRPVTEDELISTLSELADEQLNPEFVRPITESYLIQGRKKEALSLLREAVASHPDNAQFLIQLGNVHLMLESPKDAIKPLVKATKVAPEAHYAWYVLGVAQKRLGQVKPAWRAFEKASSLDPKNIQYLMSLGAAQSSIRDFDAVVKTFRTVVELQPQNASAWINLGKAYAIQKRFEEAAGAFGKALDAEPGNQTAKSLLQKFGSRPRR
ncbi:MAG: tetratricopeptide repeat protein [Myxococcota bacterium]|nr:tetratricopeptide repeat protein [Myxococcota bacterium]